MKEILEQHIKQRLGKVPPGLDQVLAGFEEIVAKKQEVLVEINEVCRRVYFIVEGCLRVSTYNINGDESTIHLAFEGEWRTAMSSFLQQQASNERIICVEPTKLLAISYDRFLQYSQAFPEFERIYKNILEESYNQSIERVQTLMGMDALDRLKWLLEVHPLIFTRLSNRLIASYLGLSEATLSRLKAKL